MKVFVFAEERSGSTWLSLALAERLGLEFRWLDTEGEADNALHMTHHFSRIPDHVGSSVLLRAARKDRLEQFLSNAFLNRAKDLYEVWADNPHVYGPKSLHAFNQARDRVGRFSVSRSELRDYTSLCATRDTHWVTSSEGAQTVYYEDLAAGVAIPSLGIDRIGFDHPGAFEKLPYDKRQLVTNLDEVIKWFKEFS
jgi:hypothetical protein